MTFKEWLLSERERFLFTKPITFSIWTDEACRQTAMVTADIIDVRWEDWAHEKKNPSFRTADGVVMMGNQQYPPASGVPFSAPLADGRFLNWQTERDASIDSHAFHPLIRKDWARFAEFVNGNHAVKSPAYLRPTDIPARVG
jgi:hypothetical protein